MQNVQGWHHFLRVQGPPYVCGYCDSKVDPDRGWSAVDPNASSSQVPAIRICSGCGRPSFFDLDGSQTPRPLPAEPIRALSDEDLNGLYEEARKAAGAGAHRTCVLACTEALRYMAVRAGAGASDSYSVCLDWLDRSDCIPPQAKPWIEDVRQSGWGGDGEIAKTSEKHALTVLRFVQIVLQFKYSVPSLLGAPGELGASVE